MGGIMTNSEKVGGGRFEQGGCLTLYWYTEPNYFYGMYVFVNGLVSMISAWWFYRMVDGALPISWVSWSGESPVGTPANRPHQTPIIIIQSAVLATRNE